MEFFKNTNIDFLRVKWICIGISWALIMIGIISIIAHGGLREGIDFTGGTQIVLKFSARPDPVEIEKDLKPLNLGLEAVQRYDIPVKNEVLIKVKQQAKEGVDVAQQVSDALSQKMGAVVAAGKLDINNKGRTTIEAALLTADPDKFAGQAGADANKHYAAAAEAIVAYRSQLGMFTQVSDFNTVPGVSPAVRAWLAQNAQITPFTILSSDNIGPQVGRELRTKAFWAIVLSTLAMLIYIAIRFDFKFGVGAIVAIIHDTLITIGILSLLNREFTLVVVAAILTLVGYSMNDTVVVYDRIRENLRNNRRDPMAKIINDSINQTLSRTVMSSGLTFLVVLALFLFGGETLNTFALTLVIGIIVGTYSSIYVASPIVVIWNEWSDKRRKTRGAAAPRAAAARNAAKPAPSKPSPAGPQRKSGNK